LGGVHHSEQEPVPATHEAALEAALERWRRSAPQLAELTDGELLGAALLLAELDEAAT